MWYFTWILGVLLACSFGIINAMWLEANEDMDRKMESDIQPDSTSNTEAQKNSELESSDK
jgi:cyd operon protein YbgT